MGSFSMLTLNIDKNIDRLQNQNEVIAYVDETLSEDEARAIEPKIAALDNVASVTFVTREQAMQTFTAEYDSDLFDNIDASFFRHRYVVTLNDLSLMKDMQAALKNIDGIADVTAHLDYAENFITFRNIVSVVSVVLIVILIAVSLFIMTNTIKLATFGRREEIAIMKMVGATNRFIRLPFVVEGLVLGLVGGLVAFLLQFGLYSLIVGKIMSTMAAGAPVFVRGAAAAAGVPWCGRARRRIWRAYGHSQLPESLRRKRMKTNRKVVRSVICVLLALIFVVSLMTALIPVNASAASQSEINQLTQQRKELQAKQKEQQKTISNLRAKKASIVEQKAALDQEMNLAQQEIEVVKEQITAYDQQIEDKGVELEAAKQEEEAQTVRFRGCVRHLEEYGQMSYIAILLEATSLSDLLARMDMVGEVIAYNKQVQADMTAAREKVETVKAELEDARVELQDKQSELETKQVELQQKSSEAAALLANLESNIDAYKQVQDQYAQQEQAVQSQIDKQVEELRRQEEQNKKNDPSYDPGKANGATGSMMWPCPSCHTITSPFGWRYHPIYHTQKYHSGVDIGASYGATIVAADGGTIITAGSVSGYGNCVVINHGNGITTLYGHMSSIAVRVGQKVSKGQTIGYVGSTGNSTGPHLHWEVTVNGVRQNPLNYAT